MIKQFKKGQKVQITKDFWSTEMDCKCKNLDCKITYIDIDHMTSLQDLRNEIKKPVKILSGFRCTKHNIAVKGKKGSSHLTGKATDITVDGMETEDLAKACADFDGRGVYKKKGFVHVDSRGYRARWIGV